MSRFLGRWFMAVAVVAPAMLMAVPAVHRWMFAVSGPHAGDTPWQDFRNMAGFYGGYVLVAATIGSLVHSWLVRRNPAASPGLQILWAVCVGVVALLPQAALFGRGYWLANIVAGAAAGCLYGVLVTVLPLFDLPRTEPAQ